MKNTMQTAYQVAVVLTLLVLTAVTARAESLFEGYSSKGRAELSAETSEMGRSLRETFDANEIGHRQMEIDFSEYRSSLKKALHYATRLASYSEYERDLDFARDKEIFQGLPESQEEAGAADAQRAKQDFMHKKYERMQQNVDEEVATYIDLLQLSLDACEALARHDLAGFVGDTQSRERMREFVRGEAARAYALRQDQLSERWPEIATRVEGQLRLWGEPVAGPNDPILDPAIVRAL